MAGRTVEYKRRKRARLYERQGGLCFYCKRLMVLAKGGDDGRCPSDLATIEHLEPKSRGGTMSDANTVAACFWCNNDRSDGLVINQSRRVGPQARVCWQDD